ncbi:Ldh family oxidoreductase [Bradyrhizobium valentinum]|uniref:Uncharacterized protein n=1 Tax=Bradyrhizobium valentinum TaxID=1518501 RepID=A0A0R3LHA4_9BRAD|nr:Ldh family oxidoreductase [Bradyrhizobium valentinum]KRR07180.1 hypothetical protein CP49_18940 [Bradyrhizobium valentinum]
MIGLYFAVGSANHLPPWGGLGVLLSTNPIAAAIPASDEKPIVLDMRCCADWIRSPTTSEY